ncbi:hypothetical protein [Blastococcus sp. URHD0036]|uniref:hypothetical protein n=1 Tax=Blastococcus sp. URHD0036 TaxID=1380356 RepID=UPI0004960261|nr:hypothetical protein [Blastococcus sp. URHD0036]
MTFSGTIRYDRRVSNHFLAHFLHGGVAHSLTEYARNARFPVDLQMRHNPKTGAEHASLYVGLTSVLNVESKPRPHPRLALTANARWASTEHGFDPDWSTPADVTQWTSRWSQVEGYLEQVIPVVAVTRHAHTEGAVQAAVSAFSDESRVMLDREVTPHFLDTAAKEAVLRPLSNALVAALEQRRPVQAAVPKNFGAECDLLAVDRLGRLLAVEVKPKAPSLVWTPAQATMYARVLQAWVADDCDAQPGWTAVVTGMLEQRRALGLAPRFEVALPRIPEVVPVIAFQRGVPQQYVDGLWAVQQALLEQGVGDPTLEVYEVSLSGRLDRVFA